MIPKGGISNTSVQEIEEPSYTWRLDFTKGRITGMLDELEAIKQAVFMILQTERFKYIIYSFNYGHELRSLMGKNPLYVKSEITRIIKAALKQDDRIQGIENMNIIMNKDGMTAAFTVITNYGDFKFTQEVR
ncbi:DUF2634 domain-containing protein [Alkaliphilus peptidifermentans]|uniref:DUF2634 domain-containing protein n=1 Tax=Alkaliphilus peptidifermentans DSM 18978 TaxID=1120976 RepID=A0A1G5JZ24_9FIRM|nr:DUF2634 domain-containing protein [Alkaliphilus peptidifermentans]SCY93181.1 Protein of unknown function [Alkaliphilus peptidifermentans DSM 18978]